MPAYYAMAICWLSRAADTGSAEAISNMGWLYSTEGISLDKGPRDDDALAPLTLAFERGSRSAPERLERLQTAGRIRADRAEARDRAIALILVVMVAIGKAQEMNASSVAQRDWAFAPRASMRFAVERRR